MDAFNNQFLEYLNRSVLEKVTETQINRWKTDGGIVHYISVYDVIKPGSVSCQERINWVRDISIDDPEKATHAI